MDTTEQNYGSTLAFSIVCSSFDDDDDKAQLEAPTTHITRTYDTASTNLSQNGCWHCIFTETKKRHSTVIDLHLSLTWMPKKSEVYQQSPAQEQVSRIRSIKVRSDATLSELFVGHVDGREILRGAMTQFRLQSDRVLRNGRYKFRITFHTQDISQSRHFENPLFATFLDINSEFDPIIYHPNEPPDVCFQFPIRDRDPIAIHAHASVLESSRYFAQQLASIALGKGNRKRSFFDGTSCTITEFSPAVFRVMLRYLYTGQVEMIKQSEDGCFESGPPSQMRHVSDPVEYDNDGPGTNRRRTHEAVHFEDLYRIAERYGVDALKSLSVKAIQCNLNMAIAISMLAKLPEDACQQGLMSRGESFGGDDNQDRFFRDTQVGIAMDVVKEYIQFFSTEVTIGNRLESSSGHHRPSIQQQRDMILEIGDCVLSNMIRLWKGN